jgi:hypothetical protein
VKIEFGCLLAEKMADYPAKDFARFNGKNLGERTNITGSDMISMFH